MTSIDAGPNSASSLAQVLFESSSSSGCMGPWGSLGQAQLDWWTNYADIARQFMLDGDHGLMFDTEESETFDAPTELHPLWTSAR